ncbi:MAG: hypothetical protein IT518_26960 [Burkholderiales bacterium]|nr:hypothetical protein [Burkholderiales bacterium]
MTRLHGFAIAAALAVPVVALAHHGWSEYDHNQVLKLTGTIEEAGYEHPHGHIKLKTPTKVWIAVLAPPSRMDSRGLAKDMLKAGATATVEGYPNKSKPEEMRAERITVAGKTVELR